MEFIDKITSKTNIWTVISIFIFLISIFHVIEINFSSSTELFILSIFISYIISKIGNIEYLWKLLFLKQLANIEIYKRTIASNPVFIHLSKDAQKDINKIDSHIKDFFVEFTELSIISTVNLLIFILLILKLIALTPITILALNFNNLGLILFILFLNILFLYNAKSQIEKDFLLYKQIYEKYSRLEGLSANNL